MNKTFVEDWLQKLKNYWFNKNIDKAVSLFKNTTFYQETPFMKPYTTFEEINQEWQHVKDENIQKIEIKPLAIAGYTVIAEWILKQNNQNFDGIYEIKFNESLECIYFKSWEMEGTNNMELIEIVDEFGNFTGQIIDKEEAHDKNLLHNEVAVFIINDKKQVLLQKRSANKRFHPNKWALCAGHVGAKEGLETAALRELKEEVGIDLSINELKPFAEREFTIRDSNSHITYFYYIKSKLNEREFIIQKEELSEVKWFNINDVINMIQSCDESIVFDKKRLSLFEQLKEL